MKQVADLLGWQTRLAAAQLVSLRAAAGDFRRQRALEITPKETAALWLALDIAAAIPKKQRGIRRPDLRAPIHVMRNGWPTEPVELDQIGDVSLWLTGLPDGLRSALVRLFGTDAGVWER